MLPDVNPERRSRCSLAPAHIILPSHGSSVPPLSNCASARRKWSTHRLAISKRRWSLRATQLGIWSAKCEMKFNLTPVLPNRTYCCT